MRRGNETAKYDRVKAIGKDLLDEAESSLQLVVMGSLQALGDARHAQQPFPVRAFVCSQLANVAAGSDINGLGGFFNDQIKDGAAADFIRFAGVFSIRRRGAAAQGGRSGRRTGGKTAQQSER